MRFIHVRRSPIRWVLAGLVLALVCATTFASGDAGTVYATNCQNLIINGSMDETGGGWTAQTSGTYSLFSSYQSYSGAQAAYLGGVDNAQDQLGQTVALPANRSLTLTFRWLVNTEEASAGWDGMTVQIADANGSPKRILFAVSDRSAGLLWQQATLDLSDFAGQTVQLQFNARTDASLSTDFFIDDVALMACDTPQSNEKIFLPNVRR